MSFKMSGLIGITIGLYLCQIHKYTRNKNKLNFIPGYAWYIILFK